ncbi:MAG: hypothetical protein JST21_10245 [Bacteroidetes bacterium]|nr:hypothetical protein [Bacteroidota bacterium]
MKTTLNLRFDKDIIDAAKKYAAARQTSISEIVETYLQKLTTQNKKKKFASDDLIGTLKKYKSMKDEEIKSLYMKGKHNA